MEYHEIRYFISVMRMLNFTQAAIHCNVTQPALTRAIQKLEDRVGGQLFCRERGNVHLTELGRALAPHFLASAEAAGAALATAAQFRRLARADVRIEVATSVDPSPLAGFLAFFHQRHPGIALTPIERDSDGAGKDHQIRSRSGFAHP